MASLKPSLLFTLTLLLIITPQPSSSLPFSSYQTLFSLAHSLTSRVANLRASRGDIAGAARARSFAQKIRPVIVREFWPFVLSVGCDYVGNYSRMDVGSASDALGLVSDLNELMRVLNELTRFDTNGDRAAWVQGNYNNVLRLFSLAHSLTSRVTNLRASRGDIAGAARARSFAQKIRPVTVLGFWRFVLSVGWDYVRNYSWRDVGSVSDALGLVSDLNELMRVLNELTRFDTNGDRAAWVQGNYNNVLRVTKSLFGRLTKVFYQQGPLREVVQMLQKEVVEGEFLRDCLELGSDDLKALIQIFKDIALQYSSTSRNNEF